MAVSLEEIAKALDKAPPARRREIAEAALTVTQARRKMRFVPLPGPQTEAYLSKADIMLYGGSAAGGKSALLVGLGSQEHRRAIIFRRESSQTDGLEEFGKQVIGDSADFAGSPTPEWTWADGRSLKLAGMKEIGDWIKHAGRERDFIGYDEAGEFAVEQVASLIAWNRGPEGQRCRVVLASNPPRRAEGRWMLMWFAPWLDRGFPDPAKPGELRWAIIVDGNPHWVEGPGEYEHDGERYNALSFTFVPASLKDNPYRDNPDYRARLQSLPEPLRSQLLYGDFSAGVEDNPWQCIPTAWVQEAMKRWTDKPPVHIPMCAMGVDVAQGGADKTVISVRHDSWFGPLQDYPGSQTPSGSAVAGLVISKRRDEALVIIDIGGGWGGDAHAHLKANGVDSVPFMGIKPSNLRTRDKQLKFANVRSQVYWQFREALDPEQAGGSQIMLPPDKELLADLIAPTYSVESNGIQVEPKDKLVKRIKRSPDKGDAVVMCWSSGAKMASEYQNWQRRLETVQRTHIHKVVRGNMARIIRRGK